MKKQILATFALGAMLSGGATVYAGGGERFQGRNHQLTRCYDGEKWSFWDYDATGAPVKEHKYVCRGGRWFPVND